MKQIFNFLQKIGLIGRIAIGLILGIIFALLFPNLSFISVLGQIFVGALKAIAPILVFLLIMTSIAKHKSGQTLYVKNIVILYAVGTFLGALTACITATLVPVTLDLKGVSGGVDTAPKQFSDVIQTLLVNIVENPVSALSQANYLSILFWSILVGFALKSVSKGVNNAIEEISDAANKIIKWIINCAPIGIFGLVFTSISESGLDSLLKYGQLILMLVFCMLFSAFVLNAIVVAILLRANPYPLIWYTMKNSAIFAFFMRSSAANIPNNLKACEKLGLNKESYSISIPLGATINMAGAAVTITIMTLSAVHTMNLNIDFVTTLILSILATFAAAGASGVAGGSLLLIPLACGLFGINQDIAMQVVGVGFIIGVIQDSVETALNSSADLLFTATSEFHTRVKKDNWKLNLKEVLSN